MPYDVIDKMRNVVHESGAQSVIIAYPWHTYPEFSQCVYKKGSNDGRKRLIVDGDQT